MRRVQLAELAPPGIRAPLTPRMITISGGVEVFGQRLEQAHVPMREPIERQPRRAQRALGGLEPARLAEQITGADQYARRDAIAGRDRVVAETLAAMDQCLVIVGREEESAELGSSKCASIASSISRSQAASALRQRTCSISSSALARYA